MPTRSDRFRSWLPQGFEFESPQTTAQRIKLENKIRVFLATHQYTEVSPPLFDFARTFSLTEQPSQADERSFELRGNHGESLAIRSDTTIQIIKADANRRLELSDISRYSYIQPVYYNKTWGAGQQREIHQAGIEIIGDAPNRFEEILQLARAVLKLVDLVPKIIYGDTRFLKYIKTYVPEKNRPELSKHFYNKDSLELARIANDCNLNEQQRNILVEVPITTGASNQVLDKLKNLCKEEAPLMEAIQKATTYTDVIYDFSLVRELSYYTGPVFEGYVDGSHERVLSGGVYDDLFSEFSSQSKPACGYAANLSIIIEILEKQNSQGS